LESLLGEINIFDKYGTDLCNKRFIEKNDMFWKLLWPHMCTNAIQSLPFYTTFCVGSGKFENRLGRMVHYGSWFNLSKQELQISIPGDRHRVARYFEGKIFHQFYVHNVNSLNFSDCFDGGSCLKLPFDSRRPISQRLFVTDFNCSHDLLIAYAIKRETQTIDMELILHLTDKATEKNAKILCNGNNISPVVDNNQEVGQQVIRIQALDKQNAREITVHVQQRRERHLPGFDFINDWEIRYKKNK
jgi:endo-beta-N-acetylglucosaminidase D